MVKLSGVMSPAFFPVHRDICQNGHTHYWLNGGRGSTKSTFISLEIVLLLIQNPNAHAVVLRKVGNTIKDSVFAQMLWAIEALGLSDKFSVKISPIEIAYRCTGQKIMFRGADDKSKLKSIKAPFGYTGIAWYEELDQFSGADEIRSINQSLMRGGDKFYVFYSYNPPKSRDNWVNIEVMQGRPDRFVHHSTYLDVPPEWLGDKFILEAELLNARKPNLYEHEYMGIATGTGGEVFDNVRERMITDEEISTFDKFYYGLDFGFSVDPLTWCKLHYNTGRRILYILDEIYEPRMSTTRAVEEMRKRGTGLILADSEEPRSIDQMKSMGLRMEPAKKGPDSVEHGIKWLQDLEAIIIDKRRTPNAYREFSLYEYERNRDGGFISAYPDKNNHYIDACRYALSNVMRNNAGWNFSSRIRI